MALSSVEHPFRGAGATKSGFEGFTGHCGSHFRQPVARAAQAFIALARSIALALGVAMALGVVLTLGNTLRLGIESRREEIVVIKLIGGGNAFARRPFLYTGALMGALGGLVSGFHLHHI